jgi:hypothetical protein
MENWAIVIGINTYWKQAFNLNGAVRDAEKMFAWLLKADGGNVPPRNLYLLLDPAPAGPLPPGVRLLAPNRDNIVLAIEQLIQRSEGQGERFFFHFSGHGLSTVKDFALYNGIIPNDFTEILTGKAIGLSSIYNRFLATRFQEQYFFIDACRNIPFSRPFRISDLDQPGEPVLPFSPQFIMYATSSGLKAAEVNEQGAFTGALLKGLAGAGSAKVFSDELQEYVVTWDSLFKYVEAQIKARKLEIGTASTGAGVGAGADDTSFIQEPKREGRELSSASPILARFPLGAFDDEELFVNLMPQEIAPDAEVVIGHLGGEIDRKIAPMQLPVQFSLEPRRYSVRAAATNYISDKPYYPVELYGPTLVNISFEQGEISSNELNRRLNFETGVRDLHAVGPKPGKIKITASDQLAPLVLLDDSGQSEHARGNGIIYLVDMQPGFYRARLYTPEGNFSEKLFELFPGETEDVVLDAPPPADSRLLNEMTRGTRMLTLPDNMIEPSEAVGPIASAQVSTLLALTGGAVNEGESYYGNKLRQTGVRSFQAITGSDMTSGVQILLGIEAGDHYETQEYLSRIRLACWGQGDGLPAEILPPEPGSVTIQPLEIEPAITPQNPFLVPTMAGLGECAWAKPPGAYWLSIETPDQEPVAFAVSVLPDRLALVIFTRDSSGKVEIFQYLPSLVTGDPLDTRVNVARFPILQRSELIQRAYLSGRLEEPDRNAEELLYAKWIEPVAGALGSYILLKTNPHHHLLPVATDNMMRFFSVLSDSHVIKGMLDELVGDRQQAARREYLQALDAGLPIFSEGLEYLVKGCERLDIQNSQVNAVRRIYQHHVPGMMWTAIPVRDLQESQS